MAAAGLKEAVECVSDATEKKPPQDRPPVEPPSRQFVRPPGQSPAIVLLALLSAVVAVMAATALLDAPDRADPGASDTPPRDVAGQLARPYLEGLQPPPPAFRELLGYVPTIVALDSDQTRAIRHSGDGCSWAPEAPFGFNFAQACATHDYGYDLIRAGVSLEKAEIDNLFRQDLMTECSTHGLLAFACRPIAELYYRAAVVIGQKPAVRTRAAVGAAEHASGVGVDDVVRSTGSSTAGSGSSPRSRPAP